MGVTVTVIDKYSIGDRYEVIADVTFDSTYPAGGEAVTAANFGLDLEIKHIACGLARDPDTHDKAFSVDFDSAASKLILFASDDNNAADSPLLELSGLSTPITDASAYTARVVVKGR
jgi:hypothetical protein